jgi:hypothetical protein
MSSWSSLGHGMRRRIGAPSNHIESTGNAMANRTHQTSDEHYAAAKGAGSHRIPMGMDAYSVNPAPALQGTLVPKKSTQAGDPTAGGKANRANIEKIGATYRVAPKTTFVQVDPAAGPTMANARVVPSVAGRTQPNFQGGIEASSI